MDYCTAEDIQVALGYTTSYSVTSRPTLAQVGVIISNITNELDLYLSMIGVNSQPSDSRILGRLKEACTLGSAARVGFGYENNSGNVENTLPSKYWDRYQAILKEIIDNPQVYGAVSGGGSYIDSNVLDGTTTIEETKSLFVSEKYEV
jgi:hypothetical protein